MLELVLAVTRRVMAEEIISFQEYLGFDIDQREDLEAALANPEVSHVWKDAWVLQQAALLKEEEQ